jgi:GT2 family glycosyltransferase
VPGDEGVQRSIASIERQFYSKWRLLDGWQDKDFDYLVPLQAGDELSETALYRFAEALQANPQATVLYGDQDERDARGRRTRPWFKPRWNAEMFFAQDFVSAAVAIKRSVAEEILGDVQGAKRLNLDELMLGATSAPDAAIVHVPHILCHVSLRSADRSSSAPRAQAIAGHLRSLGATSGTGPFGTIKVQWPLPATRPFVSIIIPTRDRVELLRPCVDSLLRSTTYEPFEIIVVDNGSTDAATLEYLKELELRPSVRVLSYDRPYNYSAINNFAVQRAGGDFLCLLNNDTEVLEPDWLTEMMRYAVRDDVGAVGAKLLYDDGTIQHAGVVVGLGEGAGHAHRFQPADDPGYFRQAHVAQFVSAVTAACLVTAKRKFDAVGGLDAENLAIAYNDVDLCLKLQAAGWRNVYVPHAVLLHHESKSRGSDVSPEHIERYSRELRVLQERWGTSTYDDPLHNPNLDRYSETFVIRL